MLRLIVNCMLIGLGLIWANLPVSYGASNTINVYPVDGIINPVVADYMAESIQQSIADQATAVIFQLDTPGGLVPSTRLIVKSLLNADIPVVVYVSPSGARAASAGTFITMAGHFAAMAPGTNIGAAHPVSGDGKDIEGDMRAKIENDLAAFARSIAEKRGRNAEWAEQAVRESVSITEAEALEKGVIDLIATDIPTLITQLDGRQVSIAGTDRVLKTTGTILLYHEMTWRQRFLAVISHPQFIPILFSLGSLGLMLELYNPGLIFPGVVGAIALLLAFYSMQALPINYSGLALIGLAFIMFILETQIPSFGMLTIGAVVSMSLGFLMLVDSPEDFLRIPLTTILAVVGTTTAFFLFIVSAATRSLRRQPVTGQEGMIGALGTVTQRIDPTGTVALHGSLWTARSSHPIEIGDTIRVTEVDGLKLTVNKTAEEM